MPRRGKIIFLSGVIVVVGILVAALSEVEDPGKLGMDWESGKLVFEQVGMRWQKGVNSALRAGLWGLAWTRLPPRDVSIKVSAAVSERHLNTVVRFDDHGVAHIEADDIFGAAFAAGFCQAQDRLFQLDFVRKLATARLHELFGEAVLPVDRILFDLGLERHAIQALPSHERECETKADQSDCNAAEERRWKRFMGNFTEGINAYLSSSAFRLPVEYVLLYRDFDSVVGRNSARIKPFSTQELFAVVFFTSLIMSRGGEHEIVRAVQVSSGGPAELLEELLSFDHLMACLADVHLPGGIEWNQLLQTGSPPLALSGLAGGSNAWAVAPHLTASGFPILAGDPHLPPTSPSPWYAFHMKTRDGQLDVHGLTSVGTPMTAIGHNQHAAWSVTLSFADSIDYFVERVRNIPSDAAGASAPLTPPPQYFFKGEWRDLHVHHRDVTVAGRQHRLTSYASHHGPLMSMFRTVPVLADAHPHLFGEGTAISMSTAAFALNHGDARQPPVGPEILNYLTARDYETFFSSWRGMQMGLNVAYADRSGNIGYHMVGKVPIRPAGSHGPLVPSEGWTGDHDWQGFVPFDELPHALNPSQGFVVSTNNRQIDASSYPHYISDFYAGSGPLRSARATELLAAKVASKEPITVQYSLEMQWDCYSDISRRLLEVLLPSFRQISSPEARLAEIYLQEWDHRMHSEAVAPSIFHAIMHELLQLLFTGVIPASSSPSVPKPASFTDLVRGRHLFPLLKPASEFAGRDHLILFEIFQLASANRSLLVQRAGGLLPLLQNAVANGVASLRRQFGRDPRDWRWGRWHTQTFVHPMGRTAPGDALFNMGPVEVDGDDSCLCHTARGVDTGQQAQGWVPSARMNYDLSDWDSSTEYFPPGNSANAASAHHKDMLQSTEQRLSPGFAHHYSDQAVRKATKSKLTFSH